MPKCSRPRPRGKPANPPPDCPLFPHNTGRWAKKIRGKFYYFGGWEDPQGALERYLEVKDDLLAGRTPRPKGEGFTVVGLCNHFLTHKDQLVDSGELAPRTFQRYYATCALCVETFGKKRSAEDLGPEDFQALRGQMAKRWGPVALGNEIQIVRSVFRYGYDADLLEKPVRFGPGFKKPSAKTIRLNRVANGSRMFKPVEILGALKHAGFNMRAMILLGINGGLGNTDLGLLPIKAVDLQGGFLDYPRPKTGIPRRIPLWPETAAAIRRALAARREPKAPGDGCLLFIGSRGQNYVGKHKGYRVAAEATRVLKRAGVKDRTFYDLRRTFQTVAEEAHDLIAVQSIMGHAPSSGDMSAVYRQLISDERLKAVTDYVRRWLFGSDSDAQPPAES